MAAARIASEVELVKTYGLRIKKKSGRLTAILRTTGAGKKLLAESAKEHFQDM